ARLADIGHDRRRVRRGRRRLLRLLPGVQGIATRSDRRTPVRVSELVRPSSSRWHAVITFHRKSIIIAGAIVIVVAATAALSFRHNGSLQYFGAAVERGDIRDAVELTGTVNAVVTVQVGSQVSGTIAKLNADFNSRVHRGDVIAEIEPSILQ